MLRVAQSLHVSFAQDVADLTPEQIARLSDEVARCGRQRLVDLRLREINGTELVTLIPNGFQANFRGFLETSEKVLGHPFSPVSRRLPDS